jgi:hypothetical protein
MDEAHNEPPTEAAAFSQELHGGNARRRDVHLQQPAARLALRNAALLDSPPSAPTAFTLP